MEFEMMKAFRVYLCYVLNKKSMILLFIFIFMCLVCFKINSLHTIKLSTYIKWEKVFYSDKTQLFVKSKTIVHSRNLMLWGKYPYLAGSIIDKEGNTQYFVYDISTKEIEWYQNFNKIKVKNIFDFNFNDFVTFGDLKGQWSKKEKLELLRSRLKES